MIEVCAAVIRYEGKILLCHRDKEPGGWEFPGGKLEPGESFAQALVREIREELALDIAVGDFIAESYTSKGNIEIHLRAYDCRMVSGTLSLSAHDEFALLAPKDVLTYDLLPADIPIAKKVLEMSCAIRMLQESDYPLMRDFLYEDIFVPEGEAPPPRSILDLPELRIYYEGYGTQPGDIGCVVEYEGEVVGMAWTRIIDDYGHIADDIPSLSVSLLEGYRGRGLGTRLLEVLFVKLKQAGFHKISLSVQRANAALRLYERLGFTVHHANPDDLVMWKEL